MAKIVWMGMSGLYKVHIQMKELLRYVSVTFWGLIENSLWSLNDAKVVCTQLGYGAEGAQVHRV